MVTFTRILYPTDLSPASVPAFRLAVALARWYEAPLTVLHVAPSFDPLPAPTEWIGGTAPPPGVPTPEEVREAMARLLPLDEAAGVAVTIEAKAGEPAAAIVNAAVTGKADLIVMGTHGRSGVMRLLLGSVAEKVVHRAPCPVLTVPGAAQGDARTAFQRILCPVDFSAASDQAAGFALDLARQANGTVTLLNVIEWLAEDDPVGEPTTDLARLRTQMADAARTRLSGLVAGEPRTWCTIEERVGFGRAHREILRVAGEDGADLIVMGAQGRGSVGLALFGSATQQVLRAAACPVLVVRPA